MLKHDIGAVNCVVGVCLKMGCQLGKLAASERRSGNDALADGPPPQTDPRLPLTAKQKYSMVASWKGISRAMEKTGICMFIR